VHERLCAQSSVLGEVNGGAAGDDGVRVARPRIFVCVAGAVFLAPLQKQLTTPPEIQSVALLQ
jgi:hypothetical protein